MRKVKGFTLVELSFSLVFISILSLAMVFVIINTIKTYSNGVLLNKVNTVGMDLVDDMRSAIQNSESVSLLNDCVREYSSNQKALDKCKEGSGRKFSYVVRRADVRIGSSGMINDVPAFGAICSGSYSYIWNSGYFEPNNGYEVEKGVERAELKYKSKAGGKEESILSEDFRLLKVIDENRLVCASMVNERYEDKGGSLFDLSTKAPLAEEPIELLPGGGNNLVLYNLMSNVVEDAGGGMLYSVSFILGSIQGGININATSNYCATSEDAELENLEYCSVNKFNFATLVAGRKKDNEL